MSVNDLYHYRDFETYWLQGVGCSQLLHSAHTLVIVVFLYNYSVLYFIYQFSDTMPSIHNSHVNILRVDICVPTIR